MVLHSNIIKAKSVETSTLVNSSTVETKSTLKRDYTQQFSVELTL